MDGPRSPSTRHVAPAHEHSLRSDPQAALGRPLSAAQLTRLDTYAALLLEATGRLNLTAVRDRAGIERRHLIESLALLALLEAAGVAPDGLAVIDVGSGGGLPGIPIAIARLDLSMTLLEATGKKAAFLRDAVAALEQPRTTVLCARAEDAGRDPAHRGRYDLAVARAVAPLDTLVELTLPLLRAGGRLAAVKGSRVDDELSAAGGAIVRCGGRLERVLPLHSPEGGPLALVLVLKERPTPDDLPRRPGMPAKRPLR